MFIVPHQQHPVNPPAEINRTSRAIVPSTRQQALATLEAEIREAVVQVVEEHLEHSLEGEVDGLLGRAKKQRRDPTDWVMVSTPCPKCGSKLRRNFYRNGHYSRSLLTLWGALELAVPRVECQCGGDISVEFTTIRAYDRLWYDVDRLTLQLAALSVSLRETAAVLQVGAHQAVAIGSLNRRISEVAVLSRQLRQQSLERVPAVVMLDGIWGTMMKETGKVRVDKQGRKRRQKRAKRVVVLVAYGIDPVSGEKEVIGWEIAGKKGQEDAESWQRLLEQLERRGLSGARGLRLFVHDGSAGLEKAFEWVHFGKGVLRQRCIFHKMRNVLRDVAGEEGMTAEAKKERRKEILKELVCIYNAADEEGARTGVKAFREKWGAQEPKAVATLERDFGMTIVYYRVVREAAGRGEHWDRRFVRATSALERSQRGLRQKMRQVVIFHSENGLDAAVYLVVSRRQWMRGVELDDWAVALQEDMLAV